MFVRRILHTQQKQATSCEIHFPHHVAKNSLLTRDEIPEMLASLEALNAGFCLTDPSDPRHQYMSGLRWRFGDFLHRASASLRQQGEENTVDAVHMLVRIESVGDNYDSTYRVPPVTVYPNLHARVWR